MVAGIGLAIYDSDTHLNELYAGEPAPLVWNIPNGGVIPLDLRLDSEKRQPDIQMRDSINIIDSIRWVDKYRYRIKYKTVSDRTTAREAGEHPDGVNPDTLAGRTATICALEREEQPSDTVGTPKVPSIQLSVGGKVVYSNDDNHSTGESQ
jgi:hypothetical protein